MEIGIGLAVGGRLSYDDRGIVFEAHGGTLLIGVVDPVSNLGAASNVGAIVERALESNLAQQTYSKEGLLRAMLGAHEALLERPRQGAGCLTVAWFGPSADRFPCMLGHVGDSRAWQWRADNLRQLTVDDVDERHRVSAWIGEESFGDDLKASKFIAERNDVYVFTTDGVHRKVGAESMAAILAEASSAQGAADRILAAAVAAGSTDNMTVLVFRP